MLEANSLKKTISKKEKMVVGLNSGTSADGIDAALVRLTGSGRTSRAMFIAGKIYKFSAALKAKIKKYAEPEFDSGKKWLELDIELAEQFSRAAMKIIKFAGMKVSDIDLIGSHGQTIRHLPHTKSGSITCQLGDPSRIAVNTGLATVGDFRVADTAAGGQGAPLTPIVNAILFGRKNRNVAVLNIGGIANISVIKQAGKVDKIFGCDTGPGNMLVDYLARRLFNKPFDKGGKQANRGIPDYSIIKSILALKYYSARGPKSVGREEFGSGFGQRFINRCRKRKLKNPDIMATAAMLTVEAVAKCILVNRLRFDELILTGGGARNLFFKREISRLLPSAKLTLSSDYGYPEDYLEAISFAVLANEAICSNSYLLKNVTGSAKPVISGKICQA